MNQWTILQRVAVYLPLVVLAGGCASDEAESPSAAKLRTVVNVYLDYAVAKSGRGPADEAALKAHVRGMHESARSAIGVDVSQLDQLFVSDRDQEPFVVLYGSRIGSIGRKSRQVLAHERTGVGGKKLVSFVSGKVELADEARLQQLLSGTK